MSLATEYDQWHREVLESDPGHADESSPWYELLTDFLVSLRDKRVLEVACGRGGFTRFLASKGAFVHGVDFSATALQIARDNLEHYPALEERITYVQADVQDLPFGDDSFDAIVSCETVEHLPDPTVAVREMFRVCSPGGRLYLTTPNYLNLMGLYELYAAVRHPGRRSSQPLDRRYVFTQVRRFVTRAGWKILRTDGTVHQFPFIPGHNPVRFAWLERSRVIRKLLSPCALHYFMIAEKENAE
jgi:ubiquinone/menaquinone biosynthesis C-methylase UbiE